MKRWRCVSCEYIYDPDEGDPEAGVKPGTPFEELPDDWVCPSCGVTKDHFEEVEYEAIEKKGVSENVEGKHLASEKLMKLLNMAVAREIQVSIQYIWQHILAKGIKSAAVEGIFRKISITEMKHAEEVAERLAYLGGTPTTKPTPIFVGGGLKEMIQTDVKAEEEAIALYKQIIKVADEEGDITTRGLFEDILSDEEGHHDTFTKLLGKE